MWKEFWGYLFWEDCKLVNHDEKTAGIVDVPVNNLKKKCAV